MSDWTTDAADAIERTVGLLRDRTVEPATALTKAIVYGLVAALVGIPAFILALVGAFRGLDLLLQGYTWAAWTILGGILVVGGLFCWTRRKPRT